MQLMLVPERGQTIPRHCRRDVVGQVQMTVAQHPSQNHRNIEVARAVSGRIMRRRGDQGSEHGARQQQRDCPGDEEWNSLPGTHENSGNEDRKDCPCNQMRLPARVLSPVPKRVCVVAKVQLRRPEYANEPVPAGREQVRVVDFVGVGMMSQVQAAEEIRVEQKQQSADQEHALVEHTVPTRYVVGGIVNNRVSSTECDTLHGDRNGDEHPTGLMARQSTRDDASKDRCCAKEQQQGRVATHRTILVITN